MKKILLIENDEILLNLLKRKLTQEGYEVLVAKEGEKGIQLMKELAPNLVLLDIDLPKKGGFEIMEEINKDRNLKKIPIILISNAGQPEEIEKGKKLGAKDFLIKTEFDPQEVLIKVAKQIGNQYG